MARRRVDDEAIIAGIAGGLTNVQIAERADCSIATVTRRRGDPKVQAEVSAARTDRLRKNADRLADVVTVAAHRLAEILADNKQPPTIWIQAARAAATIHGDQHERSELVARLDALEQRLAAQQSKGGNVTPLHGRNSR